MTTYKTLLTMSIIVLALSSCTSTKSSSSVVQELKEESLKESLETSKKPLFIEFYADWCRPCKKLEPIFEKVALKYKSDIKFIKTEVKKTPDIVEQFNIEHLPTMIFYSKNCPNGKRLVGFTEEEKLTTFVSACLEECK